MPEGDVDVRLLTENINRLVIRDNRRCLFSPLVPTDARWANADVIDLHDFLRMDVAVIKTICAVEASQESSRALQVADNDGLLQTIEMWKEEARATEDREQEILGTDVLEQASRRMQESSDGEEVTSDESSGEENDQSVSPDPVSPAELSEDSGVGVEQKKLSPAARPFVPMESARVPVLQANSLAMFSFPPPPVYNPLYAFKVPPKALTIRRTISVATNFVKVLPLLKNLFVYNISVYPPCPAVTRRCLFLRLMQQEQRFLKRYKCD
jgi:hypothetical protein